jgi:type II secretory pathway component PulC
MDVTTQRRSLGILAAGLLAATGGAVGWSVSAIDQDLGGASQSRSTMPTIETSATDTIASEDQSLMARQLRQPLYDPPPQPPAPRPAPTPKIVEAPPQPPPTPKLDVTLVGTIIQSDQRLAIVADASGGFDVKGIGEDLELSPLGMTVETIESERVTLRYQGRQSTIELDRSKGTDDAAPSGAKGNREGVRRRNNR